MTVERMDNDLRSVLIDLSGGSLLRLHDSVGKAIGVMEGSVWVTQDGDPRDVFVEVGESFVFDRPGLAIAQALAASKVVLFDVEPAARPMRPRDVTVRSGAA